MRNRLYADENFVLVVMLCMAFLAVIAGTMLLVASHLGIVPLWSVFLVPLIWFGWLGYRLVQAFLFYRLSRDRNRNRTSVELEKVNATRDVALAVHQGRTHGRNIVELEGKIVRRNYR